MKGSSVRFLATEAVYKCNIEARSRNHFCSGKTITITYSECVSVALVIQHALRIIISACPALTIYFFHII